MESIHQENIPVRMATSLRQQAEEIAQRNGVSLNHFVTQALQEKMDRLLEKQQLRASRQAAAS